MERYLISPEGECFPAEGHALADRLGDPDPDFDLAGFVVRNLGYVPVAALGGAVVRISLRPCLVGSHARQRLKAVLRLHGLLVELTWLGESWRSELMWSGTAIRRLAQLCREQRSAWPTGPISRLPWARAVWETRSRTSGGIMPFRTDQSIRPAPPTVPRSTERSVGQEWVGPRGDRW